MRTPTATIKFPATVSQPPETARQMLRLSSQRRLEVQKLAQPLPLEGTRGDYVVMVGRLVSASLLQSCLFRASPPASN